MADMHVDIGLQTILTSCLARSSQRQVTFVDDPPMRADVSALESPGVNILQLLFADAAIGWPADLLVAERVGLGCHGDPADRDGTQKAVRELARVLVPGGDLGLASPIGQSRVCFNSHHSHAAQTVWEHFSNLARAQFLGVHDDNRFVELSEFWG